MATILSENFLHNADNVFLIFLLWATKAEKSLAIWNDLVGVLHRGFWVQFSGALSIKRGLCP